MQLKRLNQHLGTLAAIVGLTALTGGPAFAAYPERPVTLTVNYPPGGMLDIVARLMADAVSKQLGQTVVVENRAGAAGQVGGQSVARQKPDGYSLLMTVDTLYTVNPFVYSKSKFDARKELDPISMVGSFSLTLLAHPSQGVKTAAEFFEKAKATDLTYSSAGLGAPGHLAMERLNQQLGGRLTHIPYQGNAPATNALLAGQTDVGFLAIGGAIQFVNAGRLIPLAVSSATRDPLMPNVPTIAELGIKGLENFDVEFGYTLMAPKGTPQDIEQKWSELIKKAFEDPAVRERLAAMNLTPLATTPEQTRARLDKVAAQWEQVIKTAGISIQ